MRFKRREKLPEYRMSDRRKAAFLSSGDRERKRVERDVPLLAEVIETSPLLTVEEEQARRARVALNIEQEFRDHEARLWRKARKQYFAVSKTVRKAINAEWDGWPGPATALYLNFVVEKHNGAYAARLVHIAERNAALSRRVTEELIREREKQRDLFLL